MMGHYRAQGMRRDPDAEQQERRWDRYSASA